MLNNSFLNYLKRAKFEPVLTKFLDVTELSELINMIGNDYKYLINGGYEDAHNELVTENVELALQTAYRWYTDTDVYFHNLNSIEVWDQNKKICEYGILQKHKINAQIYIRPHPPKLIAYKEFKEDFYLALNNHDGEGY